MRTGNPRLTELYTSWSSELKEKMYTWPVSSVTNWRSWLYAYWTSRQCFITRYDKYHMRLYTLAQVQGTHFLWIDRPVIAKLLTPGNKSSSDYNALLTSTTPSNQAATNRITTASVTPVTCNDQPIESLWFNRIYTMLPWVVPHGKAFITWLPYPLVRSLLPRNSFEINVFIWRHLSV